MLKSELWMKKKKLLVCGGKLLKYVFGGKLMVYIICLGLFMPCP